MWSGAAAPAYEYSHDFADDDPARYRQRYLPEGVAGPFYVPTSYGDEAAIKERLDRIARLREVQGADRSRRKG
jgi:replication-associated recombination protein RarA